MLSRLFSRFKHYGAEVRYASRVCTDGSSLRRLFIGTLLYHLANFFHRQNYPLKAFPVSCRPFRQPHVIWLRPLAGDIFIFYEIFHDEVYRLPAEKHAESVRWVIDCGANIGLTSLYFADKYPNARILSVEPIPANFELLQRNTAHVERIVPVRGCVSDSAGERYFSLDRPAYANAVTTSQDGCKVPAYTVAQLMAEHGVAKLDILKIDVEGEEEKIFKQADFLLHTELVVVELHNEYYTADFRHDLLSHGFEVMRPEDTFNHSSNHIARRRAVQPAAA